MAEQQPRSEQVNLRMTKSEYDVVQALIFLDEGRSSATDVLRDVVERYLAEQAGEADVQQALHALATRRAKRAGKLRSLRATKHGSGHS